MILKPSFQIFTFILLCLFSNLSAQNFVVGTGFAGQNWNTPVSLSSYPGGTLGIIRNPQGLGNQYFRLGITGVGEQSPSVGCIDIQDTQINDVTGNTEYVAGNNNCTKGAWFINAPNTTDRYVIKTPSSFSNKFRIFRVQGEVQTLTNLTQSPTTDVTSNLPVTVQVTLSNAFNVGQAAWLRYTTDQFNTSTVVKMTGSGTTYSASIPALPANTSVIYYVFTSGDVTSIQPSLADYYTFNLINNGGSNYNYVVGQPPVPDNLVATPEIPFIVNLSWSDVENETGFKIFRTQTSGSSYVEIGSTNANDTTFEDVVLNGNGITYYYVVRAVYDTGESANSTEAFVTVTSLENNLLASKIKVFPNPIRDDFALQIPVLGKTKIKLINEKGVILTDYEEEIEDINQKTKINVKNYPSGLYFLFLRTKQGDVIKRIIKN